MLTEQFRIVDDPKEICAARWRPVARSLPGFRIEVFRALAAQSAAPRRFKIFLVEDPQGIHAAAVCQQVTRAGEPSPLDSLLFGRARKFCDALRVRTRPYLSFFLPLGGGLPISARAAEEGDQRRWLTTLLDGIERYAEQHGFGLAFGNIPQSTLLSEMLTARNYLGSEARPTTMMAIDWQDMDGYIAHLRRDSASAAKTVRNERRRARKLGITIRRIPFDEAAGRTLYDFARRHYRHKNGFEPAFAPDFFSRLAALAGDDFVMFEARRHGECTGMLGMLRSADTAWMAWLGFAETARDNDFTYFNLAYYEPAGYAPAAGIRTLLYGNSVYGAKLRRGCRLARCDFFYRPQGRVMRALARPCFRVHRAWYRRKFR